MVFCSCCVLHGGAEIWNFWRLSEYKLAGNEIFLRHWRLELVQSKCIVGCQGGLDKSFVARKIVILGRHLI